MQAVFCVRKWRMCSTIYGRAIFWHPQVANRSSNGLLAFTRIKAGSQSSKSSLRRRPKHDCDFYCAAVVRDNSVYEVEPIVATLVRMSDP